ncbi:MAG: twin-arginine translocase subunit TatC, partial [Actinobacteria bacterium]|nr:twin-arginine translocase subunit TatC [Actinomycetota bacterium]
MARLRAADFDERLTLVEHLDELRNRIIVVAVSVVLAGIIGFVLSEPIAALLPAPLPGDDPRLVQLTVGESLAVRLRIALYVGVA